MEKIRDKRVETDIGIKRDADKAAGVRKGSCGFIPALCHLTAGWISTKLKTDIWIDSIIERKAYHGNHKSSQSDI